MNIDKLKKQIDKFQSSIRYYEILFQRDGNITPDEQALLNKLNESIEKINNKIKSIQKSTIEKLTLKYNDCKRSFNLIKESLENYINDNQALSKNINSFDSDYTSYFKKFAKSDFHTQNQIKKQKEQIKKWQTEVLAVKEKHIKPVKDLSKQKANPKMKSETKKIATYKDVTKYQIDAIVDLFKNGNNRSIDNNAAIHHNDVKQGNLDDCYFLAALAAVAKANPSSIKNLITPKKDGTYDVKLYIRKKKFLNPSGLNPIIVNVSTELPISNKTDNPIYARHGDNELWVSLVEKAFAKLNGTKYDSSYKKVEWGHGYEAIENITGHAASHFIPKKKTREDLIEIIQSALIDERPITAGTKPNKKNNFNFKLDDNTELVPAHEYYIININNKEIELRNPHGNDTYIGGNIFTIDISNFISYFSIVSLNS
ncbi:C2 family cysteine protease [Aureispira anguillae]|uniref:C2 family cysteine protease n=1 Tax=Aureispira anguillae TaxID=2864201 RepID=A0A915YE85_9BACT|nr:C2 family cysteine protease [Aureispira anguillae]BDS11488.1 C2 family cysteine protease [Aureispira anguillae]